MAIDACIGNRTFPDTFMDRLIDMIFTQIESHRYIDRNMRTFGVQACEVVETMGSSVMGRSAFMEQKVL